MDNEGNPRELHVEEALEAIHFDEQTQDFKVQYQPTLNKTVKLVRSEYFNTNLLEFDQPLNKSFAEIDSFVIYICLDGQILLACGDQRERLETGEVVLIPADIEEVQLLPARKSKVLEVYC